MAISLQELKTLRDGLYRARAAGVLTVSYNGRNVTYRSDDEMAKALGRLDRDIAELKGQKKNSLLPTYPIKGL